MQRLYIQQKLCDVVAAAKFYQVLYTDGTGKPITYDPTSAPNVPPTSVRVNEIAGRFGLDKDQGQIEALKQVTWTFALYLEWDNIEVDLSFLERDLMLTIPFIAAQGGYRSVTLYVLSKEVVHPVQQGASTGTQAKYLFQAELGRA